MLNYWLKTEKKVLFLGEKKELFLKLKDKELIGKKVTILVYKFTFSLGKEISYFISKLSGFTWSVDL